MICVMKKYNKLIRDKIPAIIEKSGKKIEIAILSDDRFKAALNAKLQEEVAEYLKNPSVEELADLLEVLVTLAEQHDINLEELNEIRINKKEERGGFSKKILLKKVW